MSLNVTPAGDAFTANPLSQFSATTSAQLRGALSDELGSGAVVCDGASLTQTLTFPACTASIASYNVPAGTVRTSPVAGDNEFDGAAFYQTVNTTSGRGHIGSYQVFRITGDLSTRG